MRTGLSSILSATAGVASRLADTAVSFLSVLAVVAVTLVAGTLALPDSLLAQGYPDVAIDVTDEEIEAVLASPEGGTDRQIR
ncbi:MAG: hypothetical protein R3223_11000, partial [Longimicrobiales bacterium]|nr:hypothetical protein [Longimicrobiales bacterium]